jgi:hypothetical protein
MGEFIFETSFSDCPSADCPSADRRRREATQGAPITAIVANPTEFAMNK